MQGKPDYILDRDSIKTAKDLRSLFPIECVPKTGKGKAEHDSMAKGFAWVDRLTQQGSPYSTRELLEEAFHAAAKPLTTSDRAIFDLRNSDILELRFLAVSGIHRKKQSNISSRAAKDGGPPSEVEWPVMMAIYEAIIVQRHRSDLMDGIAGEIRRQLSRFLDASLIGSEEFSWPDNIDPSDLVVQTLAQKATNEQAADIVSTRLKDRLEIQKLVEAMEKVVVRPYGDKTVPTVHRRLHREMNTFVHEIIETRAEDRVYDKSKEAVEKADQVIGQRGKWAITLNEDIGSSEYTDNSSEGEIWSMTDDKPDRM